MGKIKVHIDTSEYEGKMSKSVIVETDDPDMPEFQLTVKAEIISPIQIQPKRVYFIGRKKEILKAEVKIKANINKPLKIKPVFYDLKGKVEYEIKEIKKDRMYKIVFKKLPLNERKINGVLKIKTNYSEMPCFEIEIKGYLR
jgi:hypothetical protein